MSIFLSKSSEEQKIKKGHPDRKCPIFLSKSSEEQKMQRGRHVRTCPVFLPKLSEEQKRVISYANDLYSTQYQ